MPPSGLPCPESQQVSPVDEPLWLCLMEPQKERWQARAGDSTITASQQRYAAARARRLSEPYANRMDGCARAGVPVSCGCKRDVRWFTCRAHLLCKLCRKQRSKRLRAKIGAALEARIGESPPGNHLVMMTITLAHTGDIGDDRRELNASWKRFRKAYHRRWGSFPFIGTHEVTPGDDGLGHVHAHVVCVWPRGNAGDGGPGDWGVLREMWLAACPTARRVSFTASRNASRAARYISKYVSKGVQTSDFSPELRACVLAGTYNTRWVFTSRHAWVPFVPCCKDCGRSMTLSAFRWHGPSTAYEQPYPDWDDPGWRQEFLALPPLHAHA